MNRMCKKWDNQENNQFDPSFIMEKHNEDYSSDGKSSSEHLLRCDYPPWKNRVR